MKTKIKQIYRLYDRGEIVKLQAYICLKTTDGNVYKAEYCVKRVLNPGYTKWHKICLLYKEKTKNERK